MTLSEAALARIRQQVDEAPPLTPEQCGLLAALLRPSATYAAPLVVDDAADVLAEMRGTK